MQNDLIQGHIFILVAFWCVVSDF